MSLCLCGRRLRRRLFEGGLALALWLLAPVAPAHYVGLSDAALEVTRAGIRIIHTVPEAELAELVPGDTIDGDVRALVDRIAEGWSVRVDDEICSPTDIATARLPALSALQFRLRYDCGPPGREVTFDYPLAGAFASGHETFGRIYLAARPLTFRFRAGRERFVLPVARILARSGRTLPETFRTGDPNADFAAEALDGAAATAARPDQMSDLDAIRGAAPGFFALGVRHILEGPDHIAFILGLLLVPAGVRSLIALVTMFTVAHSLTLALAYYRIVDVPPSVTEPLIALSIVAIGLENLAMAGRPAAQLRLRLLTVFVFGLMHGVGLSYQISALPVLTNLDGAVRLGLFNLGVEAGQLAVLAVAGAPLAWALRRSWGHHVTLVGASALVGLGSYWLLVRTLFA